MPLVVITGCSGGGKSTLIAELAHRNFQIVDEPGRRIVREELAAEGLALPWVNMEAFARRAYELAASDYSAATPNPDWTFCDRSMIDAASGLQHLTGEPVLSEARHRFRYHKLVFFAEPWPDIFSNDAERQHGLDEALAETERLRHDYVALGYELLALPRASVAKRADFVLSTLGAADPHRRRDSQS